MNPHPTKCWLEKTDFRGAGRGCAEVTGPWKVWKHPDGGFKNVPPGFILPGRGNSVGQCFRLWMLGDPANGIRPFRALSTKDFGTFEASSTGRKLNRTAMTRRYCEWKKLFECVCPAPPVHNEL